QPPDRSPGDRAAALTPGRCAAPDGLDRCADPGADRGAQRCGAAVLRCCPVVPNPPPSRPQAPARCTYGAGVTAQRPRDRLRRLHLAAYSPEPSGAAERAGDGARHRAHARNRPGRHARWAIRPVVLARVGLAVLLVGAVAAAGVALTGLLSAPTDPEQPAAPTLPLPRSSPDGDGAASPSTQPVATAEVLLVHVAGAVAAPGLVQLTPGDRIADAIDAAGGATGAADLDRVNLAAPVADGQRVYVPADGETPPAVTPPSQAPGEVDT